MTYVDHSEGMFMYTGIKQDRVELDSSTFLFFICRKAAGASALVETLGLSHGALDVERPHVLPVLLQQ